MPALFRRHLLALDFIRRPGVPCPSSGAAIVLAPPDIAIMTTLDSYHHHVSHPPIVGDARRWLDRVRVRARASLPVIALTIFAVAMLYLRIRLYLPRY